ncbi:MAG: DNA (cytosine-5-)-methyltransferase [Terriglobales bacterium]
MIRCIPPGGNWKHIPESIPSRRLAQIRTSFAAGKGSRSTYYGRLHPDFPSYTISTYFNRPGNGCYIHYEEDRLISQREAARLQSFPDNFVFAGSRRSVNQQIGNAVPPLLAFFTAKQLGEAGQFIDLFSGAGGMSLGFVWAGWRPLLATDIDETALKTQSQNIHDGVIAGDIRRTEVFEAIVKATRSRLTSGRPFFVVGGPPCQGFSTAGERRSLTDERNGLFAYFRKMLAALEPDGFAFENVPGILNMLGGAVFRTICDELAAEGFMVHVWKLGAEGYAVPQRRMRVIVVGVRPGVSAPSQPEPVTALPLSAPLLQRLPVCISVEKALSDLPPVRPGQDASALDYVCEPRSIYQKFMRGEFAAAEFISALRDGPLD